MVFKLQCVIMGYIGSFSLKQEKRSHFKGKGTEKTGRGGHEKRG